MQAQTDRGPAEDGKQASPRNASAFLKQAVKRFDRAATKEAMNRQEALDDLRFKNGDQWPPAIRAARTLEKRPCLTVNKMKTFVHQITNDQRQNRPSINVSPVGDKGDPETARMLKGLIRQIERQSRADIAYDTGFESAVSMGWGYWRLVTDYEGEDTFDQVIKVDRISNPFTVYMDPDSTEPDGSDAKWCFVTKMLPRAEFDDLYPDAVDIPFAEGSTGDEYKTWSTQTEVRIAEYFYTEYDMRELVVLQSGHVGFVDELDEGIAREIEADPDLVLKRREVRTSSIKWCKLTAHEVIEEKAWPGAWIPVIRVIGDETDIEGDINYAGLIRDAKDPQRMYNFWVTSETELIALAPKAPWIMEEGQIEGHEQRWKEANNKSLPYLLYKGTSIAGKPALPPQRQQFAGPPVGVVQAKIAAAQDMQAATGIRFDVTAQERMYDESGKALRELKRVGDLGNFHYVDNLSRSLRFTGRQLIDLIPKIYDTERVVTILREDDTEERVVIDPNMPKAQGKRKSSDGGIERLYNPKVGDYEVAVTVGPNFATKRAEAADSMLLFMKAVPQAGPLIGDLIAKNMDWPGAEEISARLAAMLPPQLADKKLEDLPAEARGMVMALQQQLSQAKQEHDQAIALLGDKEKDRAIEREDLQNDRTKIAADYETKMASVQAQLEAKIADIQARQGEGDDSAMQMQKIHADFEAKMAKVAADMEVKYAQMEMDAKLAIMQAKLDAAQAQDDGDREERMGEKENKANKSSMREGDIKNLAGTMESIAKAMESMGKPKTRKGKVKGPSGMTYEIDIMEQ